MAEYTEPSLYKSREPIHPRSIHGVFRRFKSVVLWSAMAVFYLLPWLRWERGGDAAQQAVLFDIPGRKFYIFELIVYPQDIFWLAGVLIVFAWLLFMVTGVAGRVFCGYFCFQTLWTDLFMHIEHWIQGERPARMRLDKQPWNREKLLKRGGTYLAWLLVAFWTGVTFTVYWVDAPSYVVALFTGAAGSSAFLTTLLLTATTFVMAGFMREQVCIYMCPYARFQSVMYDRETLVVSYDPARGEAAGGRHKATQGFKTREERQAKGVGDCIDCGLCVQVCPTGIDIRDGLQIACINCGLCADACDTIMDKQGWPRGLVRLASEHELETGEKMPLLRPKVIGYGVGVLAAAAVVAYGIATQSPMDVSVLPVRQPAYVQLSDGRIQNSYDIKITNKRSDPFVLDLAVEGLSEVELEVSGSFGTLEVAPSHTLRVVVKLKAPASAVRGQHELTFVVREQSDRVPTVRRDTVFVGPGAS